MSRINGTTTHVFSWVRGTASAAVLLLAVTNAEAVLRHQYTFNDGTANDSVGSAHGTLAGAANISSNRVNLSAATQDHVSLDSLTIGINTYTALTLEAWLNSSPSNLNTWTMAAALGNTDPAGSCANCGYNYLMLQPTRAPGGEGSRVAISGGTFDMESGVTNGATDIADGLLHHMVMTVDATTVSYYLDGVLRGTATNNVALNTLSNNLGYLGRSLYAGDPYYSGSVNEFSIYDTARTASEVMASFTAGPIGGGVLGPALEVNRTTGAIRLTNDTTNINLVKYTINSTAGALNSTNWSPITNTGDSDSGGSFDPNDAWQIVNQTDASIDEEMTLGGAQNGGVLANGATRSLGTGVWRKSRFEDLTATIVTESGGTFSAATGIPVVYVGNGGVAFSRSDFDTDGDIDGTDFLVVRNNLHKTLVGTTAFATAMEGDITGDLKTDFNDYRGFQLDYDAANGAMSFAALVASVPEPTSVLTLALAFGGLVAWRNRR